MMCNPTAPLTTRRSVPVSSGPVSSVPVSSVPVSSGPTPSPSCERSFPGCLDQVREARAFIAGMLGGCPVADDAVLLISELATNACLYSASGDLGGAFTVRIERFGGHVRVQVEDQGSTWDGNLSKAKLPHGLYLLRALSASCGTYPGTQGWVTWYTLATPLGAEIGNGVSG